MKKTSYAKKLSNNILSLSQIAAQAKRENPNAINATIGMFNDENDDFYTFESVRKAINEISSYDAFSYADTDGGVEFRNSVLRWVFQDELPVFLNRYSVGFSATCGGSGAIATTLSNYLNPNEYMLVPSVMWETYITLAKEREADFLKYDLYDSEGNFNLASIKEKILYLKEKQESIIIVINDPAHNPTGFCMKDSDYDNLVNLLNEFDYPFLLLMDVAYFDFYDEDPTIIRKRFARLTKLGDHVLLNFAFSGSKSFGLYGLRIGANILFSSSEQEIINFDNAITYSARANWGSSSKFGISIINKLISKYEDEFKLEVKKVALMLQQRSKAFLDSAKAVGLKHLPYERGFFVCIETPDPVKLMNKLHKYDVYVVVTKTCIRVALCAISVNEAKVLPQIILKAINEMED